MKWREINSEESLLGLGLDAHLTADCGKQFIF